MKISSKLFFALVGLTAFVLAFTLLLVRWSFQQGFLDFVANLENTRMEVLAESLLFEYKQSGENWDFLRFQTLESREQLPRMHGFGMRPPPRRPGNQPRPNGRVSPPTALFDDNGNLLSGSPWRGEARHKFTYPIVYNRRQIAELHSWPSPVSAGSAADKFISSQRNQSVLIGLGCIMFAALLALLLTKQLLRPIKLIQTKLNALSKGDYTVTTSPLRKDELGQLTANVDALTATLNAVRTQKNEWFASISHELRTPLTVLKGEIEAIDAGIRPFNAAGLASLQQEVSLLERLIEDLYQLSLSEAGGLKYRFENVDISETLAEVCESAEFQFANKGLKLKRSLLENVVCRADEQRLAQLFHNLLNNALLYTHSPGSVYINLELNAGVVVIKVEDSSPGVAAEDMAFILTPLFRGDEARTRIGSGAGLGLTICKNIVEAHSGVINVSNSQYGGLAVSIELPFEKV